MNKRINMNIWCGPFSLCLCVATISFSTADDNKQIAQVSIARTGQIYEAIQTHSPPVSQTKDGVRMTITTADWELVGHSRGWAPFAGMRFFVNYEVEDIAKPERQWKLDHRSTKLLDHHGKKISHGGLSSHELDPKAPFLTVRAGFKDVSAPSKEFGEFPEDLSFKAVLLPVNTSLVKLARTVKSKLGTKVTLEYLEFGVDHMEQQVTKLTFRIEKPESVVVTGVPIRGKKAVDNKGKQLRSSGGTWNGSEAKVILAGRPSPDATTLDVTVSLQQTVPSLIQKGNSREFVFHLKVPESPMLPASARRLPIASEEWKKGNATVTVDDIFFKEGREHYMKPGEKAVALWFTVKTVDEDIEKKGKWEIKDIQPLGLSKRFSPRDTYYFRPDGSLAAENETIQRAEFRWDNVDVNELYFSLELRRGIRGSELVQIHSAKIPKPGEVLEIGQNVIIKHDDTDVAELTIEELRSFSRPDDLIDLHKGRWVWSEESGLALVTRHSPGCEFRVTAASDNIGTSLRTLGSFSIGGMIGPERGWVFLFGSPSKQATTVNIELSVNCIAETDQGMVMFKDVKIDKEQVPKGADFHYNH